MKKEDRFEGLIILIFGLIFSFIFLYNIISIPLLHLLNGFVGIILLIVGFRRMGVMLQ